MPLLFPRIVGSSTMGLLILLMTGMPQISANEAASSVIKSASVKRLSLLVDAAPYSPAEKEALKTGLFAAAPFGSVEAGVAEHVSQATIDLQVKNTNRDLPAAITLLFDITKCLDQNRLEFLSSPQFARVPAHEREVVVRYLENISEQYFARTVEGLFSQHGRNIEVPANVPRSVTNAEYRHLLTLAARAVQQPKNGARLASQAPVHHTVQNGDSLAFLGRKYQVTPDAIVAANPGLVPGRVRVGQIIYIPSPTQQPKPVSRVQVSQEKTVSLTQHKPAE